MRRKWGWSLGWTWLLALTCTHAPAQSVHKCVTKGGVVSYQSMPCAQDAREAAQWDAPPDPPPRAERQRTANVEHERATQPRAVRTGSSHVVRNTTRPSACEAAKADRERTLERVGLKRTFDLLSRLDEQVRNACR
ncbi:DUF4124 domain-containing protein [Lysobacter auxotrophicus]|uniref:DUF4124 domain-containing protein n=1 Tax=Lysobacter auxotrophicus TaxID=2992573 RepID=A0ABN6UPH8_9GAMM|nr:DUF4124 domain-containing protein [Lysobacter auxotrophicus]BDU16768.1 DUF4124 domain-containing protein [Lysobacter auxotrophicus]